MNERALHVNELGQNKKSMISYWKVLKSFAEPQESKRRNSAAFDWKLSFHLFHETMRLIFQAHIICTFLRIGLSGKFSIKIFN